MSFLNRKSLLAIAAVVDIAIHSRTRPVPAVGLANRLGLPARHLEPVLQMLVHHGILKGTRGPRGGYQLARERRRISVSEILQAVGYLDDGSDDIPESKVIKDAILPSIAVAQKNFADALNDISVDDITKRIENDDRSAGSFTI